MRVAFRLLNTLSFIFPPAGVFMYFAYKEESPGQAFWFIVWAILGSLFYLGII